MSKQMELPEKLKRFIAEQKWIFAKIYATTWPHEYIIQEKVDNDLFLQLAHHVDTYGYESYYYKSRIIYYDHNGHSYWHMENIINRCFERDTYERREQDGRLPKIN